MKIFLIINIYFLINKKCNLELIKSYQLQGNVFAKKSEMIMCPLINYSCCNVKDQEKMYKFWNNGTEKYLNMIFNDYNTIMKELFSNIKSIYDFNNKMMNYLKNKPLSNCKELGRIIMEYDFKEIESKYFEYLKKNKDFFITSFKGVYCAMCDYDLQKYFKSTSLNITVDYQFCRSLIENTLVPLIYEKNYFSKLFNIMTKLLMTCDINGNYNSKNGDKELLIHFNENDSMITNIDNCVKNRNSSNWLGNCSSICYNFHIGKLNNYFFMSKDKLKYFNNLIVNILSKKDYKERSLKINIKPKKIYESRLTNNIKPYQEKDIYKNNKIENNLFALSSNSTISLNDFTTSLAEEGTNLYSIGLTSIFSESNFNEISKFVKKINMNNKVINAYKKSSFHNKFEKKFIKIQIINFIIFYIIK